MSDGWNIYPTELGILVSIDFTKRLAIGTTLANVPATLTIDGIGDLSGTFVLIDGNSVVFTISKTTEGIQHILVTATDSAGRPVASRKAVGLL